MKRVMMLFLTTILIIGTLAACSSDKTNDNGQAAKQTGANGQPYEDYMTIVDEHAGIFLQMDEDGYIYHTAILAIGDYLSKKIDLPEAIDSVDEAWDSLCERRDSIEKFEAGEELCSLLEKYEILPEEFEAFANSRENQIQSYITDLETISEHLLYSDEFEFEYENVKLWHEIYTLLEECNKGYYYYGCVNHWFAGWDKAQVAYVQENVIDKINSIFRILMCGKQTEMP